MQGGLQLKITLSDRLGVPIQQALDLLPKNCLIPHKAVNLAKAYRLYLGKKSPFFVNF